MWWHGKNLFCIHVYPGISGILVQTPYTWFGKMLSAVSSHGRHEGAATCDYAAPFF